MAKINLHTVRIRNFLSFGDTVQELRLDDKGLAHITGKNTLDATVSSNGSGKTSLIDAVVWCLYGVTTRGARGDAVINYDSKKDCVVTVCFSVNDVNYESVRYRKLRSKTGFKLSADSVDITEKNVNTCEHVLGLDARLFQTLFVFGQTDFFRFSKLTPKERMLVFDKTFDFSHITRAAEDCMRRLRLVNSRIDIQTTVMRENARVLAELQPKSDKQRFTRKPALKPIRVALKRIAVHIKQAQSACDKTRITVLDLQTEQRYIMTGLVDLRAKKCPTCGTLLKKAKHKKQKECEARLAVVKKQLKKAEETDRIAQTQLQGLFTKEKELVTQLNEAVQARNASRLYADTEKKRRLYTKRYKHAKVTVSRLTKRKRILQDFVNIYGPKGVKLRIISEKISDLNILTRNIAKRISATLSVQFHLDRADKPELSVRASNSLHKLSAGENAKVDLITGLAVQSYLLSSAITCNVVFFDEPFDGLDDVGLEHAAGFLMQYSRSFDSVFVVSHRSALVSLLPAASSVQIEKTRSGSVLVV